MTAAQGPLAGRTVLVTRTRERAGGIVDLLHARGARVVLVPLISTVPLLHPEAIAEAAAELGRAPEPRWAVFTSATAVRLVLSAVSPEALAGSHVAAVGPATLTALSEAGVRTDASPPAAESTAAGLARTLVDGGVSGATVWFPCAEGAGDELPRRLAEAGAEVRRLDIYRSAMPEGASERLRAALRSGIDAVTLTSASTVRHLASALAGEPLPHATVVVCIGPQTAAEARRAGLPVAVVALVPTAAGLVAALAGRLGALHSLR